MAREVLVYRTVGPLLLGIATVFVLVAGCNPTPAPAGPRRAACTAQSEMIAFENSPGGTPEVLPRSVHEQACALRIVDIREPGELQRGSGVIPGAELIPAREFASEASGWDRHAPVVLVCRSGRRSGEAALQLRGMGFTRAASMTGGMLRWNDLKLPTVDASSIAPRPRTDLRPQRRTLTREDIVAHVADHNQVRWTKAATLMLQGTQACVDGRDAHAIVGTPGGDAGELVLALATAERLSSRAFGATDVERIFDEYLAAFGHFYLHTDEHGLSVLLHAVASRHPDAAIPGALDPMAVEFMRSPPEALQATLLEELSRPAHVGCGHLRLMLQHPDQYGVRPELVADVLRAFHRRLWKQTPELEFVVLRGRHEESAVISIELATEVHAYTRIPLVSPRVADSEVFVVHPQVARFTRQQNAAFLLETVPALNAEGVQVTTFAAALDALAATQLEATVNYLAASIPPYRVLFSGEDFEVIDPLEPHSPPQGTAP